MRKIKCFFNDLGKKKTLLIIIVLAFVLGIGIPTLARYNRVSVLNTEVWDGTVAESYHSGTGTENDPYVISNGKELAYFAGQLSNNDYAGVYFKLNNDIILNDGIIKYIEQNVINYIKDDKTYYVDTYTGEYYENADLSGNKIGNINLFNSLDNFAGTFLGSSYTIYGLYMADNTVEQLGLFTNLSGSISDVYIENALIYGGYITGGVASKANNANLKDIVFNGQVIGADSRTSKTENIAIASIENDLNDIYENEINVDLPLIDGNITSNSLTGTLVINNSDIENTSIMINGERIATTEFTIDLGTTIHNTFTIEASTTDTDVSFSLTNLNYNITYDYAITGGIVGKSSSTTISRCVNKGKVYGNMISAGLIGSLTNTTINESYNIASIIGNDIGAGLVGIIGESDNQVSIDKSYNAGDITAIKKAGLLYEITNSSNVTIRDTFNTSNAEYMIDLINDSTLSINNSYTVYGNTARNGVATGNFNAIGINDLYDATKMKNNFNYSEFISAEDLTVNANNIWAYKESSLPKLYFDEDIALASIHASTYTWSRLEYKLDTVKFNSNVSYMIEQTSDIRKIKEVYYYLHSSSTPLTKNEIESIDTWTEYTNIESIDTEGFYIIYAKVIDYNNEVSYLNSDILVIDMSPALINIEFNNKTWNKVNNKLKYIYVDRPSSVNIEATDTLSGIASLEYYLSNTELTNAEIQDISEENWITYENSISINDSTKKIVYVKATDNCNFITYANTDYISMNGYTESDITIGRNLLNNANDINITDKSSVSLEFTYNDDVGYTSNYTHNLISNKLLPINTMITLINKQSGEVYKYIVNTSEDIFGYESSCDNEDCVKEATYPLTLFKSMKASTDEYFREQDIDNSSSISEKFKIIIDFKNTNLANNYEDVSLYMALKNTDGDVLRTTIKNTIKSFNIYSNINGNNTSSTLYLSTDYSGSGIIYNSDSVTNINISTGFNYKTLNSNIVYDTTNENKSIGLAIKLVNSNNEIVNKKYLKNFYIRVGGIDYAADNDGVFRIDLNNGINNSSITLSVITSEDNMKLTSGDYTLNISNYVAYDGLHSSLSENAINIPVSVSSNYQSGVKYMFDCIVDDSFRILNKNQNLVNVQFSLIQSGKLKNPNIRVSLYKKDLLTAYDQGYSIVDLNKYVNNDLTLVSDNVYYAFENAKTYNGTISTYNNLELGFITSKFDYTGYRIVFELYDGNKKIGTIEKNFITK